MQQRLGFVAFEFSKASNFQEQSFVFQPLCAEAWCEISFAMRSALVRVSLLIIMVIGEMSIDNEGWLLEVCLKNR